MIPCGNSRTSWSKSTTLKDKVGFDGGGIDIDPQDKPRVKVGPNNTMRPKKASCQPKKLADYVVNK